MGFGGNCEVYSSKEDIILCCLPGGIFGQVKERAVKVDGGRRSSNFSY